MKPIYISLNHKDMKKINTLLYILLLLVSFCLALTLFSCKSKQDLSWNEKKDTELQRTQWETQRLDEAVNRAIEKAFKQRLNIHIDQTKYDTDKPPDSLTGLPPVSEINHIDLTNETDATEKKTENRVIYETKEFTQEENQSDHTVTEIEERKQTNTGFSFPVWGVALTIVFVIIFYLKWKRKY